VRDRALPSGLRSHFGGQCRAVAAAFTFLTRIPLHDVIAHDSADLTRAAPYFPVVGLVVGAAGGIVLAAGLHIWPPVLAVIISVSATVLLTGAFHEDALADAFDGFGGGWNAEQVLGIMKDSRVGSYALVGVTLVLAAKVAALTTIVTASPVVTGAIGAAGPAVRAIVAGHVLGGWSSVLLIRYNTYVRPQVLVGRPALGRPFVSSVTTTQLTAASAVAVILAIMALGTRAIPALIVCVIVTLLSAQYFRRRIGGITGDALGAANQMVEIGVYLVAAANVGL
jgi:adenosylcobinamide-GDP ribazoletransferase